MKKLLILLIGLALTGTAFAQDFSEWDKTVGVNLAYVPNFLSQDYATIDETITTHNLEAELFFDVPWLRLSVGYGFFLNGSIDDVDLVDGYNSQYIDLSLIGKYPFLLGDVNVWPALGLAYNIQTVYDNDSDDASELDDYDGLNDLFLLAGGGADFYLTENLMLTPSFIFGYNLTPTLELTDDPVPDDANFNGYRFKVALGVGYTY